MMIDRKAFKNYFAVICLGVFARGASAGAIVDGNWTPSGCGAAPKEYKLDLSNADAYNKSVEGVNQYRLSARNYVECLSQEANADIQAITRSAKAAQQARLDVDQKIQDDVKTADKKFAN